MTLIPKTIVIADDHPIFRVGVVNVINSIEGCKVVAEAENGLEAIDLIVKHKPDVAVIDLDMPKSNGADVLNRVVELHLPTRMVILTAHTDPKTFMQIAQMHEVSILLKENAVNELPQCLQSISESKVFISPNCKKLISKYKQLFTSAQKVNNLLKALSATEIQVLWLVGQGLTTQQIAERQNNSFKTIENHRTNIAQKLGISGANSLLVFAIENKEQINSALDK